MRDATFAGSDVANAYLDLAERPAGTHTRHANDAAGLPVAVVNPRQVRDFAKAVGQRAKTGRHPDHPTTRRANFSGHGRLAARRGGGRYPDGPIAASSR